MAAQPVGHRAASVHLTAHRGRCRPHGLLRWAQVCPGEQGRVGCGGSRRRYHSLCAGTPARRPREKSAQDWVGGAPRQGNGAGRILAGGLGRMHEGCRVGFKLMARSVQGLGVVLEWPSHVEAHGRALVWPWYGCGMFLACSWHSLTCRPLVWRWQVDRRRPHGLGRRVAFSDRRRTPWYPTGSGPWMLWVSTTTHVHGVRGPCGARRRPVLGGRGSVVGGQWPVRGGQEEAAKRRRLGVGGEW